MQPTVMAGVVRSLLATARDIALAEPSTAPAALGSGVRKMFTCRGVMLGLIHREWANGDSVPGTGAPRWQTLHADPRADIDPVLARAREPSQRDRGLVWAAGRTEADVLWASEHRGRAPQEWDTEGHRTLSAQLGAEDRLYAAHPAVHSPQWVGVTVCWRGRTDAPFGAEEVRALHWMNAEVVPLLLTLLRRADVNRSIEAGALIARLRSSQRRLLPLLAVGHSEARIADEIHRSKHTVHDHVKQIYRALGVRSRVELVHKFGSVIRADAPVARDDTQGNP